MQDRAIRKIGEFALGKLEDARPYQLYTEELAPGKVCTMAVAVFIKAGDTIRYKHIDSANVNQDNYQQYAYRKGSPRGGDITFTTKFGDLDKKLNVLVKQWPSLLGVAKEVSPSEHRLFKTWQTAFEESRAQLQTELQSFYDGLDKKKQQASGYTLALETDGERKLLAEFESVQHQLVASGTEGKKEKYKVISEGKNNVCSVCLQNQPILYGFASPFKYATVDKPGTVSGFFNQKKNWINYPICEQCALTLELGKNYITKHLTKSFFGNRYYLIPKTILPQDKKSLRKAIDGIQAINYDARQRDSIERDEDYLLRNLGKLDNSFTLNMLFFEENPTTKAVKIKLMLEEIPPSRFRTLFIDAPQEVDGHPLYALADYSPVLKEKVSLSFSFGIIKQFFEDTFYDTVYRVFTGKLINRQELLTRFMHVIRSNYNRKMTSDGYVERTHLTVLKAHLLLRYFENLHIVEPPTRTLMIPETEEERQTLRKKSTFDMEKLRAFLRENNEFVYDESVAGIFGLGVLVSLVFNMQNASIGSTPFEKKLKGFNLSASDLEKVYLEAIDKVNQYSGAYTYKQLREFVSENIAINKLKVAKMTNQERSFYFVTGLELGRKFRSDKEETNQTTEAT